MKLGVYARDYYCDELYGETDNWCYTSYIAKLTPYGTIDTEDLIKNMIDKGWLDSNTSTHKCKVIEKESRYLIYIDINEIDDDIEPDFYIKKED